MFLREDLIEIASGKEKLFKSIMELRHINLSKFIDAPKYIKFLVALKMYGEDMLGWEFETLEIVMSRDFLPYSFITDVASIIYLSNHNDYVLSNKEHFEKAINIFNDYIVDVDSFQYYSAPEIIWGSIMLAMLYSSNFKVIGSAAEYVVECLKEFHWTTLPVFIAQEELNELFASPNLDNYNKLKNVEFTKFSELEVKNPSLQNYIEFHKPIVEYVISKIKEYSQYINRI